MQYGSAQCESPPYKMLCLFVADTGITGGIREAVVMAPLTQVYDPNVSRETWSHIPRLGQLSYESADALRAILFMILGGNMNEAQQFSSSLSVSHPALVAAFMLLTLQAPWGKADWRWSWRFVVALLAQSASLCTAYSQALAQAGAIHTCLFLLNRKAFNNVTYAQRCSSCVLILH